MSQNRFVRHGTVQHPDPKFGRLVLFSIALHLAVVAVSYFDLLPDSRPPQKQTYYVDLVNMPVKSPQAGRPDAAADKKAAAKPQPRKTPTVQKSAPVKKDTVKKKSVKKKAPPKKAAVAEKPEPKPDRYQDTLSAIEKLQQKKRRQDEIAALQQKIAALSDTRRDAAVRSELGMPEGTGTEKGASYEAYLHDYLKENWSLSQYQVGRLDLEAKIELTYDAKGNL
ncbi:MAG: hypothetical protein GWO11_00055, partial [Desulfuromonadales bacterium]|nr:hypothetical protein [Desulfuromonadales bacterium]NIR32930.1 hypothetical protein [Desulfuromonadales bacterium]NIS39177.1 hypothetical protein [Desulfuromonadales bacterium]